MTVSSLLSVDDALRTVLNSARPLSTERLPLVEAHGRVLAHDIAAAWDLPMADVSVMDGYAVRSADLGEHSPRLTIAGESAAGHRATSPLAPGQAVRISTGAWLPEHADTVVPQEDVRRTGNIIEVDRARFGAIEPGRWVRFRGSDVPIGHRVLSAGVRLSATDLASAAAAGSTTLTVHRRPRVGLLSSGDELVPVGHAPVGGQVVNTNGLMLGILMREAGADVFELGIVGDTPAKIRDALAHAPDIDVLVSSGGVSVGDHDHIVPVLEELGWTFDIRGVAMRPGKPLAFARKGDAFALALPGNPASSMVGFWLFLRPLLRRLSAVAGDPLVPRAEVRLRAPISGAGPRAHFVRAQLHDDGTATPLAQQASGHLSSMIDVDALLEVPPNVPGIAAGECAKAWIIEPWWTERRPRSVL